MSARQADMQRPARTPWLDVPLLIKTDLAITWTVVSLALSVFGGIVLSSQNRVPVELLCIETCLVAALGFLVMSQWIEQPGVPRMLALLPVSRRALANTLFFATMLVGPLVNAACLVCFSALASHSGRNPLFELHALAIALFAAAVLGGLLTYLSLVNRSFGVACATAFIILVPGVFAMGLDLRALRELRPAAAAGLALAAYVVARGWWDSPRFFPLAPVGRCKHNKFQRKGWLWYSNLPFAFRAFLSGMLVGAIIQIVPFVLNTPANKLGMQYWVGVPAFIAASWAGQYKLLRTLPMTAAGIARLICWRVLCLVTGVGVAQVVLASVFPTHFRHVSPADLMTFASLACFCLVMLMLMVLSAPVAIVVYWAFWPWVHGTAGFFGGPVQTFDFPELWWSLGVTGLLFLMLAWMLALVTRCSSRIYRKGKLGEGR